jgi:hypothetical protein
MKRLLKWVIRLHAFLLLPIIGILLFGRQQSRKLDVLHIDICTLPCWINITPEKSTIDDAKQQVRLVYGASPDYRIVEGNSWVDVYDANSNNLLMTIVFIVRKLNISREDVVEGIEIQTNVSIGDSITTFASVDAITLWGKGGGTFPALLYSKSGVIVTIDTPMLDWDTCCIRIRGDESVQSITIDPMYLKADAWGGYVPQRWRGSGACYKWSFISDQ